MPTARGARCSAGEDISRVDRFDCPAIIPTGWCPPAQNRWRSPQSSIATGCRAFRHADARPRSNVTSVASVSLADRKHIAVPERFR